MYNLIWNNIIYFSGLSFCSQWSMALCLASNSSTLMWRVFSVVVYTLCYPADVWCIREQLSVWFCRGNWGSRQNIVCWHPPLEFFLRHGRKRYPQFLVEALKSQCWEMQCWASRVCSRPRGTSFSVAAKRQSRICHIWAHPPWLSRNGWISALILWHRSRVGMTWKKFKNERSMTGLHPPNFFGTRKR